MPVLQKKTLNKGTKHPYSTYWLSDIRFSEWSVGKQHSIILTYTYSVRIIRKSEIRHCISSRFSVWLTVVLNVLGQFGTIIHHFILFCNTCALKRSFFQKTVEFFCIWLRKRHNYMFRLSIIYFYPQTETVIFCHSSEFFSESPFFRSYASSPEKNWA